MMKLGALIFPGFELFDTFGPLEMFGLIGAVFKDVEIKMVAETCDAVPSGQGPQSAVDDLISDGHSYDIILVPGGRGTRKEVDNDALLSWLETAAADASLVLSVCTGSALLARAGLLDGHKATTNKMAFEWVTSQGPDVHWQRKARWVEDGKYMTSSGVSAGIDMSLAAIARLFGEEKAEKAATWAEYEWHKDASWDPFAEIHGLV